MGKASMKPTICFVTLGCAKNLVDSENMLGLLKAKGFSVAPNPEAAEIGIINTCGFIESAVEESVGMILEISEMKKTAKLKKLFVVGCLVQRFGYKLRRELPEVDGWLGTGEIHRIAEVVEESEASHPIFLIRKPTYLADHETPRVLSSLSYSAYVKIAEGCSHRCTYCTIPGIRGPFRSRPASSILAEVEAMATRGVKEINLIAQDITLYGRDLGGESSLEDLLERLVLVKGVHWIRVLYGHPQGISNRLLELMEVHEKVCPYLDVPLQHVHAGILMRMGRSSSRENPRQLIERIRSRKRPISLRSTLMVGFPGETEEAFKDLYEFVSEAEFDHLGVFVYSSEKGTRAARFADRVDRRVAEERRDAIMRLQADISLRKHRSMIGQVLAVLIEGLSEETDLLLKGRTSTMAPDVDDQVLINKGEGRPGDILPVKIREAYAYDLVGEILAQGRARK
jgi:ribosomal protein S12 methylthiotransferase